MKIKIGFVSNSSSTSFILMTKKDKVTAADFLEQAKIPLDSPFYKILKRSVNNLFSNLKKRTVDELTDEYKENAKNYENLYSGSIYTDCSDGEFWAEVENFEFKTDQMFFSLN